MRLFRQGFVLLTLAFNVSRTTALSCKSFPGDREWPSDQEWAALNRTVEGRLIRTVPVGAPCHDPNFNAVTCQTIRDGWHHALFHEASSTSIMSAVFANESCDPFTDRTAQCIVGRYPQYSINVSKPAHAISAINFARNHNIRFVVKNTGHDLLGRNIGPGSLSVWTHNLQERTWIQNYTSPRYSGPAVRIQAGVIGDTIYKDADARGVTVVGGTCPTVGIAGGYIQGGGHSVLTNMRGLAADQTLEFEVITSTGKFLHASPQENADLYWAMSGGGPTTYAILWSVTVKVFPGGSRPVSTAMLTFAWSPALSEAFWSAVGVYQTTTTVYTNSHVYAAAMYSLGGFSLAVFAPEKGVEDIRSMMNPLLVNLNGSTIPYNLTLKTYKTFREAFIPISTFAAENGDTVLTGVPGPSRLIPRLDSEKATKLLNVTRRFAESGGGISDLPVRPTRDIAGNPDNAVLPAWRQAERSMVFGVALGDSDTIEVAEANNAKVRSGFGDELKALTPGSGAYMNEADFSDPDWKVDFFGSNYPKLLRIKDKWDPDQVFYASVVVGGDRWFEQADGRLCRVV